jgi:hypothetical protein
MATSQNKKKTKKHRSEVILEDINAMRTPLGLHRISKSIERLF